jgi:hypothetical protein
MAIIVPLTGGRILSNHPSIRYDVTSAPGCAARAACNGSRGVLALKIRGLTLLAWREADAGAGSLKGSA